MRRWSVRTKLNIWFFIILTVSVLFTFLLVRYVSGSVLRKTVRSYLVGMVDANADEVGYVSSMNEAHGTQDIYIYIRHGDGFLEIDRDCMDVVYDVSTALYRADGTMLYGENPLAEQLEGMVFENPGIWRFSYGNEEYEIYDKRLTGEHLDDLWLRGVVSQTSGTAQLNDITRTTLVLLPALVLLSLVIVYIAAGRLLKPVETIERAASEISKGDDLKRRIALKGPEDDLHRLADSFDQMVGRLDMAFETERQFTSDVSHELRTPASVILAQCEYTLDRERTIPEYEDALRVIRRQCARMNTLIGDMLDYTRMTQQTGRYPMAKTDLSAIAADVCETMKLLKTRDITLYSEISEGMYVTGNRLLLQRLLENLIGNAYRYGKEGGYIRVKLGKPLTSTTFAADDAVEEKTPDGTRICLQVEDNGIGMAPEDVPHIFERFYRSENARGLTGNGMGLSMVRRIAELHGAEINVTTEQGTGSTFAVWFPDGEM